MYLLFLNLSWELSLNLLLLSTCHFLFLLRWSKAGSDPGWWCLQAVLLWPHAQQPIPDQRSHTDAWDRGTLCLHHRHDMYVVNNTPFHQSSVFLHMRFTLVLFSKKSWHFQWTSQVLLCVLGGRGRAGEGRVGVCLCGQQINLMTPCHCHCDRWHCLVCMGALFLPVPAPTQAPTEPPTTEPPPTIPPPKEGEQDVFNANTWLMVKLIGGLKSASSVVLNEWERRAEMFCSKCRTRVFNSIWWRRWGFPPRQHKFTHESN